MHVNFRETQITCHTKTNAGVLLPIASTQQLPQPPVKKSNLKAVSGRIIPTVFTTVVGHHIMIHEDVQI